MQSAFFGMLMMAQNLVHIKLYLCDLHAFSHYFECLSNCPSDCCWLHFPGIKPDMLKKKERGEFYWASTFCKLAPLSLVVHSLLSRFFYSWQRWRESWLIIQVYSLRVLFTVKLPPQCTLAKERWKSENAWAISWTVFC